MLSCPILALVPYTNQNSAIILDAANMLFVTRKNDFIIKFKKTH